MKPKIIQLDNTWCERIIDLILPIQQIEFNVPVTLEGQPDLLDIETNYLRPGGGFWGAILDNEPGAHPTTPPEPQLLGTIGLMNVGRSAGVIRKMFVKKEFRGKDLALAQQLFDILKTEGRKKGITDLYLGTVDMLKAAHRFYEKNGFQRIAVEDLPVYFPRMMADNVFYHLHL